MGKRDNTKNSPGDRGSTIKFKHRKERPHEKVIVGKRDCRIVTAGKN